MSRERFFELFRIHYNSGRGRNATQAGITGCWVPGRFCSALEKAGSPTDTDTVGKWLKGQSLPQRTRAYAIFAVFFPLPSDAPDREPMEAAWISADASRKHRDSEVERDRPPDDPSAWPRSNPQPILDLAQLELDTPETTNTGAVRLRGRLVLDARIDESSDPPVMVSLRAAHLALQVPEGVTSDGSLIGVREPHANLEVSSGSVRVIGPTAARPTANGGRVEYLKGDIFEGHHIAVLNGLDDAPNQPVTVTLSVGRMELDVTPLDADGGPLADARDSEAKRAVQDAIVFRAGTAKDDVGRAILQVARIWQRGEQ